MNLLASLARTESGGNFAAQNSEVGSSGHAGHFGRLQFGHDRLTDARRAGVLPDGTTPQQFMADPQMQQRVEAWHLSDLANQADRMGLSQYVGREVGGVPITMDAIVAMGHLGGMGGARRFLESGGRDNPADSFGTSLADYARTHGATPQSAPPTPRTTPVAPQSNPMNAMAEMQQMQAAARMMAPQTNALNAAAFQSTAPQAPMQGFNTNPFT